VTHPPAVLVTICARGGSKGVPNKNVQSIDGDPLVGHSVRQALSWERSDEVVVSTDDDRIAEMAAEYGARVPFRRPEEYATDEAGKLPAIRHATERMEELGEEHFDYVVDLDVTAPIRLVQDIENCFKATLDGNALTAVTVTSADKNPYFNMVELDDDGYARLSKPTNENIKRRQDAPDVFEMNASVYSYDRDYLRTGESALSERTVVSEMPQIRSVDIDKQIDLEFVKFLMENRDVDYD